MPKIPNLDICRSDPYSALKALSAISAIIVLLTGISIIYLGFNRYDQFLAMAEATGPKYAMISLTVVVIGLLTASVASIGFVSIVSMGHNSIMGYFYMALFTFIVQAIFGGFTLIDGQDPCKLKHTVTKSLDNYLQNSTNRVPLNYIESHLHCCGIDGPYDYLSKNKNRTILNLGPKDSLPISCCIEYSYCTPGDGNHWNRGCIYEVMLYAYNSMHEMGTLVVCSSTVSAMSAAIVYVHSIQSEQVYL